MTKLIIQIAVHVPFRGGYPRLDGVNRSAEVGENIFRELKVHFGLRSPMDHLSEIREEQVKISGSPDDCFKCALRALKLHGNLKSLKLVLPVDFRASRPFVPRSPHLNPDTVIHGQRTNHYLHCLQQLRDVISGVETPVIVRVNTEE